MKQSASDTKTVRSSRSFTHSWPRRSHPPARPKRASLHDDTQEAQPDRQFDHAYLAALRDRNPAVESHLVAALARPLWVKLHSRLRSPQLIEDARQETLLRVFTYFRSGKTLDNPASLPGFVLGVCSNVCYEFLRSDTRYDQMPVTELDPPDLGANPEQNVVTEERKRLVAKILGDLSSKDRQVLKRVFLDEADRDEVCHELSVDRDYLRLLVHRAKLKFKAAIMGTFTSGFAAVDLVQGAHGPH